MRVWLENAYSRLFWGFLGVKMKENGNFLNQTASKSLLWFSLWTRAIIGVTKKEN